MPAACSEVSSRSTRKASTTMSWVAETKATTTAPAATMSGAATGFWKPRKRIAAASSNWVASSQPRRRPSQRESRGTSRASTTGAQRNFSV